MLSKKEWNYLQDQDFLLTKCKIQETIHQSLQEVRDTLKLYLLDESYHFPSFVDTKMGKISKGENYQSLPYLVLDFPKGFQKQDIWTFRTMVWWGNEISTSLLLKGDALKYISLNYQRLFVIPNLYLGVNTSPWEYYFEEDNLMPIQFFKGNLDQYIEKIGYLKLSFKHPLSSLEQLPKLVLQDYIFLIKALDCA